MSKSVTYFLFLDYETTGKPDHKPLEMAWLLTDSELNPLFDVQLAVIRQSNYVLHDEVLKMHTENGLLREVAKSTLETHQVCYMARENLRPTLEQEGARIVLAGFSCHYDRYEVMRPYMPELDRILHYRLFDVSTLRTTYHHWVSNLEGKKFEREHRAKADVLASWQVARTFKGLFQVYMPQLDIIRAQGVLI
jgi:oligoribonuclease (3'-5' exoribonuclease)